MSDVIKRAISIGLLKLDDVHFSTDPIIWDTLWASSDAEIAKYLEKIVHVTDYITITAPDKGEFVITAKLRALDPWILVEGGAFKRLTDVDNDYKRQYDQLKTLTQTGWGVIIKPEQEVTHCNIAHMAPRPAYQGT